MLVTVTAEDIKNGQEGVCSSCPIALAVIRASGKKNASVVPGAFGCGDTDPNFPGKQWKRYSMPDVATDFVRRFDTGLSVEPFIFEAKFIYDY